MQKSEKLTDSVLVLESNARAAVGVIRSLLEHGVFVTAGAESRCCAGFFVKGLNNRVVYPSVHDKPDEFIDWLPKYLESNSVKLLFPLGDACVELVARHQDSIRKHTQLFMPEYKIFMTAYDKIQSNKAAERAGVPIPKCWYPDEQSMDSIIKSAIFPVVLKPAVGVGARGIYVAQSASELELLWKEHSAKNDRMFVQEFIKFDGAQYVVDVLTDNQGKTITAVVSEKVRFYPVRGGASTLSRSVMRPDICENCQKLLSYIGYYGIANIDLIEDKRDGVVKFLEINPRFGEMHTICNAVGIDLTYMYYLIAAGNSVSAIGSYPENRLLRFLPTDLMWFLTSPQRFRANPGFFKSFKARHTLLGKNDIGPVLGYLLENLCIMTKPKKFLYRFARRTNI